jgi:8-oxo-dGTP pyrophosphatase MutT (NUDIX family)
MNEIVCSGGLFLSRDTKRFLFLLRTQGKTAESWGLVGGKKEPHDQSPYDTLIREVTEEVEKTPQIKKVVPLELFTSNDQHFQYNTYVLVVDREFIPTLNKEHGGYAWCDLGRWPRPLHRGVKISLSNKIIKTKLELLLSLI